MTDSAPSPPSGTDGGAEEIIVCLRRFDPVLRQTVFEPLPEQPAPPAPLSGELAAIAERRNPPPSEKNDREALRWLKSRHRAPCGGEICDSVYCYIATRLASLLAAHAAQARRIGELEADAERWKLLVVMTDAAPGGIMLWSMAANEHDAAEASIQALDRENPTKTLWFSKGATLDDAIDAAGMPVAARAPLSAPAEDREVPI